MRTAKRQPAPRCQACNGLGTRHTAPTPPTNRTAADVLTEGRLMADVVGEHVMGGLPGLGVWVECECGWIGPSRATETLALVMHSVHVRSGRSGR